MCVGNDLLQQRVSRLIILRRAPRSFFCSSGPCASLCFNTRGMAAIVNGCVERAGKERHANGRDTNRLRPAHSLHKRVHDSAYHARTPIGIPPQDFSYVARSARCQPITGSRRSTRKPVTTSSKIRHCGIVRNLPQILQEAFTG